jgi:hypothetical protein
MAGLYRLSYPHRAVKRTGLTGMEAACSCWRSLMVGCGRERPVGRSTCGTVRLRGASFVGRASPQCRRRDGGRVAGHLELTDVGAGRDDLVDAVEGVVVQHYVGTVEQVLELVDGPGPSRAAVTPGCAITNAIARCVSDRPASSPPRSPAMASRPHPATVVASIASWPRPHAPLVTLAGSAAAESRPVDERRGACSCARMTVSWSGPA